MQWQGSRADDEGQQCVKHAEVGCTWSAAAISTVRAQRDMESGFIAKQVVPRIGAGEFFECFQYLTTTKYDDGVARLEAKKHRTAPLISIFSPRPHG